MAEERIIHGHLSAVGGLKGSLSGTEEIGGTVTLPAIAEAPRYEGPYTVLPRLGGDIVLATAAKLMGDDVTVKKIPVVSTSNIYGGQTVVIG